MPQGIELHKIYRPYLQQNFDLLTDLMQQPDQYDFSQLTFTYQHIGPFLSQKIRTPKYAYYHLILSKK